MNSDTKLTVSLSPHIHSSNSIDRCMWNVVIAMLPAMAVAIWTFGAPALFTVLISVGACLATEYLINRFMLHRGFTLLNGSALITGILLAFNLPSILPWWMVIIGAVVAIAIGKMTFGGLGCNIFNPALVGRVFLLISYPALMTTWPVPGENVWRYTDAITGPTTLGELKQGLITPDAFDLTANLVGGVGGSLGEVGSIAILIGLVYLLITRVITWHIPVSIIASAALFSWAFGGNPLLDIFAGGLLLGAVFMATDYVTSPMTRSGQLIYGFMIGFITIVIRRYGSYPEGVSFAILLMNSFTPLINRYCHPSLFGRVKKSKK